MQQAQRERPGADRGPLVYDAFISYSHAIDKPIAKQLQRVLQRLGRRWFRRYALRVFRDDTALAASPDLWGSIEWALLRSRTFVLLASPEAAGSEWVDREVAQWQQQRSPQSFRIVLTAGELVWNRETGDVDWERTTALPQRLRGWFPTEPLWVDLRADRGFGQSQLGRRREFRNRVATLAAAVHGVAKDELLSEELRQQRRLVTVLSTLLVLALVAIGTAVWQREIAVTERDRADLQSRIAVSRSLAAESEVRGENDPRLGAQLALTAYDTAPTPEAGAALLHQLENNRHITRYVRRGTDQRSTQGAASAPTLVYTTLSSDGTLLAYVTEGERDVVLWDTRANREIRRLPIEPPDGSTEFFTPVHGLALDPAGRVAAVDDGLRIQIWDVRTGKRLRVIEHSADEGYRLALSPGARLVARIGGDAEGSSLRVWQVGAGAEVPVSVPGTVRSDQVAFSSDDTLHVQLEDGVWTLDMATGRWTLTVPVVADAPVPFVAAEGASRLVVAARGGIELWDFGNGRKLASYQGPGYSDISEMVMSADGTTVVAGTGGGRIVMVDTGTGSATELTRQRSGVRDLGVADDGRLVASADDGGDVVLSMPGDHRIRSATAPGAGSVSAIAVDQRGGLAAVGREEGVELWELPELRRRSRLPMPDSLVRTVALNQDGSRVATRDAGTVTVVDTRSGQVISTVQVEDGLAEEGTDGVRFLPAGTGLLVDADGGPQLVDAEHDVRGRHLEVGDDGGGFGASADAGTVAVVTQSLSPVAGGSEVELWRWTDAGYRRTGAVKENADIRDVAVDTAGGRLAMVDIDGRVVLRDLESGRRRVLIVPGAGAYGQLGFTPDGSILVQADAELHGMALWDADTGVLLDVWQQPASGDQPGYSAFVAGPHGQVLTEGPDNSLVLWQVGLDFAYHRLCRVAGGLPAAQREQFLVGSDVPAPCGR